MFCDFVVKHDWNTETSEALSRKIFYSLFIGRIKSNKPCNIMVTGGSGEGKSISAGLKLQEILLDMQGVKDIRPYFNRMNVYTPLEYPSKINGLLFDKDMKPVNMLCIHESRELISSKTWQSFLTQAVAGINATSRQIKRIITVFVSQSMSDVAKEVRKTLDFLIIMRRPRGKRPRMKIRVLWLDERDPEKPVLRTRALSGLVIDAHGRYKQFCPTYFEVSPPSKDLIEIFEKADREAKGAIIKKKMDKLMLMMEKEMGIESDKVKLLVDHYTQNETTLMLIGKRNKNGWKVHNDIKRIHGLSDDEYLIFQKKVNERINSVPKIDEGELAEELDA